MTSRWNRGTTTEQDARQRGLSLLELMISLALGGFLMLGLVSMFLATRSSAQIETALARVQENGRFALDLMSQDILRSGYTGCNSVRGIVTELAKDAAFEDLRGHERSGAGWSPDAPVLIGLDPYSTARNGSDVIILQTGVSMGHDELTTDIAPTDRSFDISDNTSGVIQQNDLIILSNCLTSHLLRVTNSPATSGAAEVKYETSGNVDSGVEPGYRYTAQTELMTVENVAWYVADTGRVKNGYNVWALYRLDLGVSSSFREEMIEGVEYMQVLYGERSGTGVLRTTRFVSAPNVSDWQNVVAVRVSLLIQSYELARTEDDTNNYVMLDETIGAATTIAHGGGRALRKVFNTTLALRNTPYDL